MLEYLNAIVGFLSIYHFLFPHYIYVEVLSEKQDAWYNSILISSLLSFALGVILTFVGEYIIFNYKERKELEKYEYYLLSTSLDFLLEIKNIDDPSKNEQINKKVEKLLKDLSSDIRFFKLDSSSIIIDALKKGYRGEEFSEEITKIKDRQKKLKQ